MTAIGEPWGGNAVTDTPTRVWSFTADDGSKMKLTEYEWGLEFTNELGQPFRLPIIEATDDDGVIRIGDYLFRRVR